MPEATFGKPPRRRPPYKGVATESLYVPMSDGARIAVDVLRPRQAPANLKLPAILIIARYWRSFALRGFAPPGRAPIGPRQAVPDFLVPHGYAVVVVDSRGSGASSGSTPYPFNPRELQDYAEVVDWIIEQPWSDGQVGATGISYEGIAAELLTVAHPRATRAVVPQQADIDQYAEFLCPGGIPNRWMIETWQHTNEALDRNRLPSEWTSSGSERRSFVYRIAARLSRFAIKGVRPVDADRDGTALRQTVAEHAGNADVAAFARALTYRDDPFGPSGITVDDFSTIRHREALERSGAALFIWGSWFDGCTADGVLRRFVGYRKSLRAVIGAWSHGYLNHGSPYGPPAGKLRPELKVLWQEMLEHFDVHLKGSDDPDLKGRTLFYYTIGEEAWKVTNVWPPAGATTHRWYLGASNSLVEAAPSAEDGADTYVVDVEATTGLTNRWRSQDGITRVVYPDRAAADRRLLTYTSAPLADDIEITGHPVITLYVTSTATDGAFYVYVEDVDPNARVIYLTEGQLRAPSSRQRPAPTVPPIRPTSFVSARRRDAASARRSRGAQVRPAPDFGPGPQGPPVARGHRGSRQGHVRTDSRRRRALRHRLAHSRARVPH